MSGGWMDHSNDGGGWGFLFLVGLIVFAFITPSSGTVAWVVVTLVALAYLWSMLDD